MSRSWTGPVFQAFLADAKGALGDSIQAKCLECHAPLASVGGDALVANGVNQEGVTCNFCHNVSAAEASGKPASYTFDSADPNLMRGPHDDSDPGNEHGFVQSPLHSSSEFCASCHYVNQPKTGVPIETTYEGWRSSDAASEGEQCQDCHMPSMEGEAAPQVSKMKRGTVRAHTFQGAHGEGALDSVATLTATLEGGKLKLTIANRGAGHALPGGGGGMRSIALDVVFQDASGSTLKTVPVETYGIVYADEQGRSPVPKWLAKSVARMNEIPVSEPKIETCDVPRGAKTAEARLTYRFIDPAYLPSLNRRQVDLSGHQPVLIARAAVTLP